MFRRPALALIAASVFAAPAFAQDVEGASDHPLVGRYDGSIIEAYEAEDFDEMYLLKAPNDYESKVPNSDKDRSGPEWLGLEGKVFKFHYAMPAGRSSLEIYRNYQAALKANGFQEVFACKDADCFVGTKFNLPYQLGRLFDVRPGKDGWYWDHARYHLAKLTRDEGAVYAAVIIGEKDGQAIGTVIVVETGEMETDKIVVKTAKEMDDGLSMQGDVNIYTLYFDFDKAELKPESAPTLVEIAKLLNNVPDLTIRIVGHTDNQGGADYNLDLSRRRAAAVVNALVTQYGIAAGRLTSEGQGFNQPVADNATEDGRALNRRVQLVKTN